MRIYGHANFDFSAISFLLFLFFFGDLPNLAFRFCLRYICGRSQFVPFFYCLSTCLVFFFFVYVFTVSIYLFHCFCFCSLFFVSLTCTQLNFECVSFYFGPAAPFAFVVCCCCSLIVCRSYNICIYISFGCLTHWFIYFLMIHIRDCQMNLSYSRLKTFNSVCLCLFFSVCVSVFSLFSSIALL